jgi:hypothetical protein
VNKNLISLALLVVFTSFSNLLFGQDYNDIGRTKSQEFFILKFNRYKIRRINSANPETETYLAQNINPRYAKYDNIITIDKKTNRVLGVVWNFDYKNFQEIKSLLTDMNPTDSSYSELENKKGKAELSLDPYKQGYGLIIWKKKE